MKASLPVTAILISAAVLCFGVGITLGDGAGYRCKAPHNCCPNQADCYPQQGQCEDSNGQMHNYDGYNAIPITIGHCYYEGPPYTCTETILPCCRIRSYKTDGGTLCATQVCLNDAGDYGCPDPVQP